MLLWLIDLSHTSCNICRKQLKEIKAWNVLCKCNTYTVNISEQKFNANVYYTVLVVFPLFGAPCLALKCISQSFSFLIVSPVRKLALLKPDEGKTALSCLSVVCVRQDARLLLGLIPSPRLWCRGLWSRVSSIKESGTGLHPIPPPLGGYLSARCVSSFCSRGLKVLQSFSAKEERGEYETMELSWISNPRGRVTFWQTPRTHTESGPHKCTHTALHSKVMQHWKLFLKSDWM